MKQSLKIFGILILSGITFQAFSPSHPDEPELSAENKPNIAGLQKEKAGYQLFKWQWEPKEHAFKVLTPAKWIVEGGIFRIDPSKAGGAGNAIETKLDFTMKSDANGTASMRWFPEMFYFDSRQSPTGQMGLFPPGSNYNGMLVCYLPAPNQFIMQIVLPYAHRSAGNVIITEQKNLPELAMAVENEDKLIINMGFIYNAALVKVEYTENGTVFEEKYVTVIINLGQAGGGLWKNKYTYSIRAPKGKLKDYELTFATIGNSLTLNNNWIAGEIKGQLERSGIVNKTLAELNRLDQEIANHRRKTNEIIQNDMYLNLTGQEEYINPYTNEVEMGTNQWKNRWTTSNGYVVYSDDSGFDPRSIPELSNYEFKKSPLKPRVIK